jgi:hypothetical protein
MRFTSVRTGLYAAPVAAVLVLSSCVTSDPYHASYARSSPSVLTETRISGTKATNVYDAIQRLHPVALNAGGAESLDPMVYLDGMRLGGVSELQRIPAAGIAEIRFLNAVEATALFGPSQRSAGAIILKTRTGRGGI